jgi:hypothetical protein
MNDQQPPVYEFLGGFMILTRLSKSTCITNRIIHFCIADLRSSVTIILLIVWLELQFRTVVFSVV